MVCVRIIDKLVAQQLSAEYNIMRMTLHLFDLDRQMQQPAE